MALNYQMEGKGDPLLLIHGMGVTGTIWKNLAPLLRSHYKLIMVELPGHGASPNPPFEVNYYDVSAREIELLRQNLGIELWTILGYSMGAWVAQKYLQQHPDRVKGVIFLCPAVAKPLWARGLRTMVRVERFFPELSEWLLKGWRLHSMVLLLGFNGRRHPYAQYWTREIGSRPVKVIKALLRDLPGAGRATFEIPSCPTLVIWGTQDAVTSRPKPLRFFDRLVKSNHGAPMLAAEDVARIIRKFNIPENTPEPTPETTLEPIPNWEISPLTMEGIS
jgi:pimeloyl-ACP methyl ester carboxylesterase